MKINSIKKVCLYSMQLPRVPLQTSGGRRDDRALVQAKVWPESARIHTPPQSYL